MVVKSHIKSLGGKKLLCGDPLSKYPNAEILNRSKINILTMSDKDTNKIHKKCFELAGRNLNATEEKMEREEKQIKQINKWIMNDEHKPTKTYKKGKYDFKNNKLIIKKVYEAGLYYYTNYGYLRWDEVYDKEIGVVNTKEVPQVGKPNRYMRNTIMHRGFESLIFDFECGDLKLNPPYQRAKVWDSDDKISLIESLLDEIPIGRFAVRVMPYPNCDDGTCEEYAKDPSKGCEHWRAYYTYEIVDGKQRFSTIYEFINGQFPVRGLYFKEMNFVDRCVITGTTISVVQASYDTEKEIMEWFIALNMMGKPQNPVHLNAIREQLGIRKCASCGKTIDKTTQTEHEGNWYHQKCPKVKRLDEKLALSQIKETIHVHFRKMHHTYAGDGSNEFKRILKLIKRVGI